MAQPIQDQNEFWKQYPNDVEKLQEAICNLEKEMKELTKPESDFRQRLQRELVALMSRKYNLFLKLVFILPIVLGWAVVIIALLLQLPNIKSGNVPQWPEVFCSSVFVLVGGAMAMIPLTILRRELMDR